MSRVLGLGGVFFKCKDPKALAAWYGEHLGLPVSDHGSVDFPVADLPSTALGVWGPFSEDTTYFAPCTREFMINLVVDDVEGVLERARAGGAVVTGEIEQYDYGRFGWFIDPEGNKVELWKPPDPESTPDADQD